MLWMVMSGAGSLIPRAGRLIEALNLWEVSNVAGRWLNAFLCMYRRLHKQSEMTTTPHRCLRTQFRTWIENKRKGITQVGRKNAVQILIGEFLGSVFWMEEPPVSTMQFGLNMYVEYTVKFWTNHHNIDHIDLRSLNNIDQSPPMILTAYCDVDKKKSSPPKKGGSEHGGYKYPPIVKN